MSKSSQAFRTIREVADWLDVAAHVLRFWESKFPQVKPVKRAGGRRSGERKNAIMAGFATGLSDEDIADLAAFYAALDGLTTPSR